MSDAVTPAIGGDAAGTPAPAGVYFDASPNMVHDLPGEPDDPALKVAEAPKPDAVSPAELAAREAELAALRSSADGMPYGPDVGVALTRAAQETGASAAEAEVIAAEWTATFQAHGIAQDDCAALIAAGTTIARTGLPDEATEARWINEAQDHLAREFGGREAGERAAALAIAYVARDKRLLAYLNETGLGSHPRVILAVAKAAHNARRAGKF